MRKMRQCWKIVLYLLLNVLNRVFTFLICADILKNERRFTRKLQDMERNGLMRGVKICI